MFDILRNGHAVSDQGPVSHESRGSCGVSFEVGLKLLEKWCELTAGAVPSWSAGRNVGQSTRREVLSNAIWHTPGALPRSGISLACWSSKVAVRDLHPLPRRNSAPKQLGKSFGPFRYKGLLKYKTD